MRAISLFSGFGGFDLASEWMGWENVAHCEWNPYGQKILKHYWPKAISYEDITKTDFTIHRGRIDIVTGGFPCQPYSLAGKRKGTDDDRHLWPEMLRAIREIQPRWVVGENVFGLINWNGGLVFNQVQADLEAEGYEVFPYVLPAASVNAPHKRDRVWFVAYSESIGRRKGIGKNSHGDGGRKSLKHISQRSEVRDRNQTTSGARVSADPQSKQSEWLQSKQQKFSEQEQRELRRSNCQNDCRDGSDTYFDGDSIKICRCGHGDYRFIINSNSGRQSGEKHRKKEPRQFAEASFSNYWENFPTQSPVCDGNDGFSSELLRQRIREDCMGVISEEEIDKILSKAYKEWRNETIKAGGNAIVPHVAFQIFKAIELYELNLKI